MHNTHKHTNTQTNTNTMETKITTKSTDKKLLYVEIKLEHTLQVNKKLMDDLTDNFLYYLQWNAEQIFCNQIRIEIYQEILQNYSFDYTISKLENFVSRAYNVRTSSTNGIVREQSTWEYQTKFYILSELKAVCNEIK